MFSQSAGQGASPASLAPQLSIVERMAQTMQDMRATGEIITAESLAVWGDYTSAEVSSHAREAADLARARAVRQVG